MGKYKEDLHHKHKKAKRRKVKQKDILRVFARKILSFIKAGKVWVLETTDGRELRSPIRKDVLSSLATINDYDVLP